MWRNRSSNTATTSSGCMQSDGSRSSVLVVVFDSVGFRSARDAR